MSREREVVLAVALPINDLKLEAPSILPVLDMFGFIVLEHMLTLILWGLDDRQMLRVMKECGDDRYNHRTSISDLNRKQIVRSLP